MVTAAALPRLGLGVTGPHATGFVAAQSTTALIRHAIAAGISLFDTGPMYGEGEAERRLGAAIADAPRHELFLITKARTRSPQGVRQSLRTSLEGSLRRIGVSSVDALLLHGPHPDDLRDTAVQEEIRAITGDGLAKHIGVCGRGAERRAMLEAMDKFPLYNLLMTPLDDVALLSQAQRQDVLVIAIETMRSRRTAYRAPRSSADLWYLARTLRDVAQGRAQGEEAIGVAGALARPGVASAIVTTTRVRHLDENIAAARAALHF